MSARNRIHWGTNLITFYDRAYWGLSPYEPYSGWVNAFNAGPRPYFDRMLDGVRDAGLVGVELAPEPAGFEAALAAFGSAKAFTAALDDRGLKLTSSYAPGRALIGNALADPALEAHADAYMDAHARFLAEMGADTIVMGNIPRSRFGTDDPDGTATTAADFAAPVQPDLHERFAAQMNRLGAIAARHGVRIAIHTDAYSVCSRADDIGTVLSLTDPDTVQICLDAGHVTLDGDDAVEVLERHIDRIPTMHWKDCVCPLSAHLLRENPVERHAVMLTRFRVLGSGTVDWRAWMRVLRDAQWSGWAMEEIDHSPNPVEELRKGLEYFHRELAPIYR